MTGLQPPDPNWPRYSIGPFPPYRFVPGQSPHPRRDSKGHSYRQPEPEPQSIPPDDWQSSEAYRYGIDLYNFGYWWESHEVFEGLWHAAGHETEQGNFFQAFIQLAAANLKHFLGANEAAASLARSGLRRLQQLPPAYMGIDIVRLSQEVRGYVEGKRPALPMIALMITSKT